MTGRARYRAKANSEKVIANPSPRAVNGTATEETVMRDVGYGVR